MRLSVNLSELAYMTRFSMPTLVTVPDSLNLAPPSSVAVPESTFIVRLRFSPSAEKSAKPSEPRVVADVPSNIPST